MDKLDTTTTASNTQCSSGFFRLANELHLKISVFGKESCQEITTIKCTMSGLNKKINKRCSRLLQCTLKGFVLYEYKQCLPNVPCALELCCRRYTIVAMQYSQTRCN